METIKAAKNLAVRASPSTTPMAPNATEVAFLVKKYLEDQKFSKTLNLFRKEAAPLLSSTVRNCPPSTCLNRVLSEYVRLTLEKEGMTVKLMESQASNSTLQRQLQEAEASNSALERKLQEAEGHLGAFRGFVEAAPSHKRLPLKRKRIVAPKASGLPAPTPINWTAAPFVGGTSSGCGLPPAAAREACHPRYFDLTPEFLPGLNESPESSGLPGSGGPTDEGLVQQLLEGIMRDPPSPEPGPIEDILSLSCDDMDGMYDSLGDFGPF